MDTEISESYGLQYRKTEKFGDFKAFRYRNILYTIVPCGFLEQEEVIELKQLSDYMIQKGESRVGLIVPTKEGQLTAIINNQPCMIIRCPRKTQYRENLTGRELAIFHQRGRTFPYKLTKCNRIGQWKNLWEKRVDQMEMFWREKVSQHPSNEFEKRFIESFPYYLGLTENAIQYLVDTEMDDYPSLVDSATVCHHRLTEQLWQEINHVDFPHSWVFDHSSRDLAEYSRDQFLTDYKMDQNKWNHFLNEYNQMSPLTSFSWRLLYARILFPIHYFETIEGYYLTKSEVKKMSYENQLNRHLDHSTKYEDFLVLMNEYIKNNNRSLHAPNVNWLTKEYRSKF
ncbi:spore coat putative kinase YutH [Litchfieldia salsa]|uniref:Spore coat protein YutH n=1 Tax=Litchfieldia salsa TaxID=930152 RepID=A0A1H0WQ90_9BACI|nr:spore coat protein YutH [Litchfieldia salsa]SDP92858.1 spore coat protein YutH [Litchfieldia salsa]